MSQYFHEFAGNKRLLWIAEEWERYSDALADWAMLRLVNRRDVWSQYTVRNGEVRVVMLPTRDRRVKGAHMVTLNKLHRHFAGHTQAGLIGLHSISDHSTCKWFAVDVDLHDETIPNADEVAFANFTASLAWANRLRDQGMDPILMDSNGEGGFHLWTLLDKEYPLADTFDFVSDLRSDWEEFGLPRRPEVFPPKRAVADDDLPYGLRLPGRHHTRKFYTRIWNFDAMGENEWLEGGEAIEAMMAAIPAPLPKLKSAKRALSDTAPSRQSRPEKKASLTSSPRQKPRICLDLDGVLAKYNRWEGPERIGAPIAGALEFAQEVAQFADIVIFSTRCSPDPDAGQDSAEEAAGKLRIIIIEWLEKHGFPYKDVYVGQGKPHVAAFIDDRAVSCRPQTDDDAYSRTVDALKGLLNRSSKPKPWY